MVIVHPPSEIARSALTVWPLYPLINLCSASAEKPRSLKAAKRGWNAAKNAFEKIDYMVLLVDHKEFNKLDISSLNQDQIIDTRGFFYEASINS